MSKIKQVKEYVKDVVNVLDTIEIGKDKAQKMREEMQKFDNLRDYYPVVRTYLSICRAYGSTNNHRELQVVADYAILKIDQLAGYDDKRAFL